MTSHGAASHGFSVKGQCDLDERPHQPESKLDVLSKTGSGGKTVKREHNNGDDNATMVEGKVQSSKDMDRVDGEKETVSIEKNDPKQNMIGQGKSKKRKKGKTAEEDEIDAIVNMIESSSEVLTNSIDLSNNNETSKQYRTNESKDMDKTCDGNEELKNDDSTITGRKRKRKKKSSTLKTDNGGGSHVISECSSHTDVSRGVESYNKKDGSSKSIDSIGDEDIQERVESEIGSLKPCPDSPKRRKTKPSSQSANYLGNKNNNASLIHTEGENVNDTCGKEAANESSFYSTNNAIEGSNGDRHERKKKQEAKQSGNKHTQMRDVESKKSTEVRDRTHKETPTTDDQNEKGKSPKDVGQETVASTLCSSVTEPVSTNGKGKNNKTKSFPRDDIDPENYVGELHEKIRSKSEEKTVEKYATKTISSNKTSKVDRRVEVVEAKDANDDLALCDCENSSSSKRKRKNKKASARIETDSDTKSDGSVTTTDLPEKEKKPRQAEVQNPPTDDNLPDTDVGCGDSKNGTGMGISSKSSKVEYLDGGVQGKDEVYPEKDDLSVCDNKSDSSTKHRKRKNRKKASLRKESDLDNKGDESVTSTDLPDKEKSQEVGRNSFAADDVPNKDIGYGGYQHGAGVRPTNITNIDKFDNGGDGGNDVCRENEVLIVCNNENGSASKHRKRKNKKKASRKEAGLDEEIVTSAGHPEEEKKAMGCSRGAGDGEPNDVFSNGGNQDDIMGTVKANTNVSTVNGQTEVSAGRNSNGYGGINTLAHRIVANVEKLTKQPNIQQIRRLNPQEAQDSNPENSYLLRNQSCATQGSAELNTAGLVGAVGGVPPEMTNTNAALQALYQTQGMTPEMANALARQQALYQTQGIAPEMANALATQQALYQTQGIAPEMTNALATQQALYQTRGIASEMANALAKQQALYQTQGIAPEMANSLSAQQGIPPQMANPSAALQGIPPQLARALAAQQALYQTQGLTPEMVRARAAQQGIPPEMAHAHLALQALYQTPYGGGYFNPNFPNWEDMFRFQEFDWSLGEDTDFGFIYQDTSSEEEGVGSDEMEFEDPCDGTRKCGNCANKKCAGRHESEAMNQPSVSEVSLQERMDGDGSSSPYDPLQMVPTTLCDHANNLPALALFNPHYAHEEVVESTEEVCLPDDMSKQCEMNTTKARLSVVANSTDHDLHSSTDIDGEQPQNVQCEHPQEVHCEHPQEVHCEQPESGQNIELQEKISASESRQNLEVPEEVNVSESRQNMEVQEEVSASESRQNLEVQEEVNVSESRQNIEVKEKVNVSESRQNIEVQEEVNVSESRQNIEVKEKVNVSESRQNMEVQEEVNVSDQCINKEKHSKIDDGHQPTIKQNTKREIEIECENGQQIKVQPTIEESDNFTKEEQNTKMEIEVESVNESEHNIEMHEEMDVGDQLTNKEQLTTMMEIEVANNFESRKQIELDFERDGSDQLTNKQRNTKREIEVESVREKLQAEIENNDQLKNNEKQKAAMENEVDSTGESEQNIELHAEIDDNDQPTNNEKQKAAMEHEVESTGESEQNIELHAEIDDNDQPTNNEKPKAAMENEVESIGESEQNIELHAEIDNNDQLTNNEKQKAAMENEVESTGESEQNIELHAEIDDNDQPTNNEKQKAAMENEVESTGESEQNIELHAEIDDSNQLANENKIIQLVHCAEYIDSKEVDTSGQFDQRVDEISPHKQLPDEKDIIQDTHSEKDMPHQDIDKESLEDDTEMHIGSESCQLEVQTVSVKTDSKDHDIYPSRRFDKTETQTAVDSEGKYDINIIDNYIGENGVPGGSTNTNHNSQAEVEENVECKSSLRENRNEFEVCEIGGDEVDNRKGKHETKDAEDIGGFKNEIDKVLEMSVEHMSARYQTKTQTNSVFEIDQKDVEERIENEVDDGVKDRSDKDINVGDQTHPEKQDIGQIDQPSVEKRNGDEVDNESKVTSVEYSNVGDQKTQDIVDFDPPDVEERNENEPDTGVNEIRVEDISVGDQAPQEILDTPESDQTGVKDVRELGVDNEAKERNVEKMSVGEKTHSRTWTIVEERSETVADAVNGDNGKILVETDIDSMSDEYVNETRGKNESFQRIDLDPAKNEAANGFETNGFFKRDAITIAFTKGDEIIQCGNEIDINNSNTNKRGVTSKSETLLNKQEIASEEKSSDQREITVEYYEGRNSPDSGEEAVKQLRDEVMSYTQQNAASASGNAAGKKGTADNFVFKKPQNLPKGHRRSKRSAKTTPMTQTLQEEDPRERAARIQEKAQLSAAFRKKMAAFQNERRKRKQMAAAADAEAQQNEMFLQNSGDGRGHNTKEMTDVLSRRIAEISAKQIQNDNELRHIRRVLNRKSYPRDETGQIIPHCLHCGRHGGKLRRCGRCDVAQYCSKGCQCASHKEHKERCVSLNLWTQAQCEIPPSVHMMMASFFMKLVRRLKYVPDPWMVTEGCRRSLLLKIVKPMFHLGHMAAAVEDMAGDGTIMVFCTSTYDYYQPGPHPPKRRRSKKKLPFMASPIPLQRCVQPGMFVVVIGAFWARFKDNSVGLGITDLSLVYFIDAFCETNIEEGSTEQGE